MNYENWMMFYSKFMGFLINPQLKLQKQQKFRQPNKNILAHIQFGFEFVILYV